MHGQPPQERLERDEIQDVLGVGPDVLRGEVDAGTFPDALPVVLAVLELAQLGVGGQLRVMLVPDSRRGQECLKPLSVGPAVPRPADAAPLADVKDLGDAGLIERVDEARRVELVDADGGDSRDGDSHGAAGHHAAMAVPGLTAGPPS